jgi:hypothetical protein
MIERRQIGVKAFGTRIDLEDPAYTKYTIASFLSMAWILISVNVTIYRTVPIQKVSR